MAENRYRVEIFDKTYYVSADSYYQAKKTAAKKFKSETGVPASITEIIEESFISANKLKRNPDGSFQELPPSIVVEGKF